MSMSIRRWYVPTGSRLNMEWKVCTPKARALDTPSMSAMTSSSRLAT